MEEKKITEFNYVIEKLGEIKENLRLFDERNCRKHQEILATVNQLLGKIEEQIKSLSEEKLEKISFDNFQKNNNGKLDTQDASIKNLYDKLEGNGKDGVEDKIKKLEPLYDLYSTIGKWSIAIILFLLGIIATGILLLKNVILK